MNIYMYKYFKQKKGTFVEMCDTACLKSPPSSYLSIKQRFIIASIFNSRSWLLEKES